MSGAHPDLGPELRQLAQTILDRLDPAVKLAAARAASAGPGKCQQAWCPVCALAVWLFNERQENHAAHAIFFWLMEHAHRVDDVDAIRLQQGNVAASKAWY